MKKFICLILTLLMVLPLLVACKKEPGFSASSQEMDSGEDEWLAPVEDLGGREFKILSIEDDYGMSLIDCEEATTPLEESVYFRNRELENRLNILITNTEISNLSQEIAQEVRTQHYANQVARDVYVGNGASTIKLTTEGCFAEVSTLGNAIDLNQSWWNATVAEDLSIGGKIYPLVGKAIFHFYESTNIMAYNVDYANSLGMPNLAEKALEGNWTWEDVHTYSVAARKDLNNDSAKDAGDSFGFAVAHNLIEVALVSSWDDVLVYDEDNYPSFSGFSEKTLDIYDDIVDWFYKSDDTFLAPRDNTLLSGSSYSNFHDVFMGGNTLFYMEPVGSLEKLRDVDFEFTVLPTPKYEVNDEYRTNMVRYSCLAFVPALATEKEQIGVFLENLMYSASLKTFPQYVENIVNLQRVRNELSYRVLTEIVWKADAVISMLHLYDFGGMSTSMVEYAKEGKSINVLGVSLSRNMNNLIAQAIGEKPNE